LFRLLYYIGPFVISVILLTLREIIIGARSKRLRQLAASADTEPTRHEAAVYVRERGDKGA
jgi:glycosyltransferase 2 family protein